MATTLTSPLDYPYTATTLTVEMSRFPRVWGRIGEMGLFRWSPGATLTVEVARQDGRLCVLEPAPRGTPGSIGRQATEKSLIFKVPHIPHKETIAPEDLQDRYVFGSGRTQMRGMEEATAKKLEALMRQHAITREYLLMGALKGLIVTGKQTVMYDLHAEFGVSKKTVDFLLGTDSTDVLAKCEEVVNHIEDHLQGEVMTGVRALVSASFMQKLVSHPNVEKFYLGYQQATALTGEWRRQFTYGGITFEVYRASASDAAGVSRPFITAGYGHAFPEGTMEAFVLHAAPPHHIQFANTVMASEVFVSPKILDHGQGVELHSEANILPLCTMPELLVDVRTSN